VAAVIHAELVLVLGVAFYVLAPRDADIKRAIAARNQPDSIDIGMVDEDAARRIIADLERQQEEEQKKEFDSPKPPGQVVDLPAPREERRPDDARFVSEHDSSVARETKKYGKFESQARQGDTTGEDPESHPSRRAVPPTDPRLAMRTPDLGHALKVPGALAPPTQMGKSGSRYGVEEPGEEAPGGTLAELGNQMHDRPAGGGAPGTGAPAIMPTEQQMAHVIGGGTQDALKDIDDGEETALNSKKWRFASFFNRVKKQVAEHWHPEEAYRRRDPTGAVYGRQNRYTELRIQLKPDGHLANVALAQPSGLEFLDDEAIEAFKEAQPFPNPPRQLVESNGVINFRFGFLFDLNGPPQMRWFRYND
jgi:TonB family protein